MKANSRVVRRQRSAGVPMSTVELKRSALNVALTATWFFALFAIGAAIAGLLI